MTDATRSHRALSGARVRAIAVTRLRRVMRTRIAAAAAVFAFLPWAIVETPLLVGRLSALAEFSVVGLTVLGAGAISDDLDSGEFAIAISHDVSPLEILLGNAMASMLVALVLVAGQLPLALRGAAAAPLSSLGLCVVALVALLAGWLALMLLFATFLEGKANAVAMGGVLLVPFAMRLGVVATLPARIASIVDGALRLLPQVDQAAALFRALLYRSPLPVLDLSVLIASPLVYFVFASLRLYRLEPAGRLTQ
jgi:ABC-type transport system involved in multi-copper enzyme maturation permease subunit